MERNREAETVVLVLQKHYPHSVPCAFSIAVKTLIKTASRGSSLSSYSSSTSASSSSTPRTSTPLKLPGQQPQALTKVPEGSSSARQAADPQTHVRQLEAVVTANTGRERHAKAQEGSAEANWIL